LDLTLRLVYESDPILKASTVNNWLKSANYEHIFKNKSAKSAKLGFLEGETLLNVNESFIIDK
jgi:hypothetical protein